VQATQGRAGIPAGFLASPVGVRYLTLTISEGLTLQYSSLYLKIEHTALSASTCAPSPQLLLGGSTQELEGFRHGK